MFFTKRKRRTRKKVSSSKELNIGEIALASNQIILNDLVAHLNWDVAQGIIADGISNITAAHLLPAIVCLACGGEDAIALRVQSGWTLLSYGIKVHDDLIDDEPVESLLDRQEQLALGAIIIDLAYVAMDMAPISDAQYRAIVSELALSKTELMLAQAEKTPADTSTESYFAHILRKSGNYFSSACKVGAIAAGIGENQALFSILERLGLTMGMAIQIGDDIMDIAKDVRKRHFTLPILLAIQDGDEELLHLCNNPVIDDVTHSEILQHVNKAIIDANKLRNVYIAQSRQCLTELRDYISDDAIKHLDSIL